MKVFSNIKISLSVNAEKISNNNEFDNISVLFLTNV